MRRRQPDPTQPGDRFGPLEAVRFSHVDRHGTHWVLRCPCGELVTRITSQLRSSVRHEKRIIGCRYCASAALSKRLREAGYGRRNLARRLGSLALLMVEPVDIDAELPDTF